MPYTHIKLNCGIFDFSLKKVSFQAKYGVCLFEPNGNSVIANTNQSLVAYDENLKIKWERGPLDIHHQIEKSKFADQLLMVTSRYMPSRDFGLIRYDELLVFSGNGTLVKSFSFADYFKKYPQAVVGLPQINGWTTYNHERKTYEVNHGNSFTELYSVKDGKRVFTGYIFNCIAQQKIYIFDTELKSIVKEIRTRKHLHTVRQYDEDHVVAYENAEEVGQTSSIQLISLKDGRYSTLYESKNPLLSSVACSSVQVLPEDKLFIVHSNCSSPKNGKDLEGYYLEFVDLRQKKSFAYHIEAGFARQNGELINAETYLKKNIGQ